MSSLKGKFENKWRVATAISIAVIIVLSAFVVLYQPQVSNVAAQPYALNVSVDGPKKIGVNEVGTYTATVNSSYQGSLEFSWSINPSDSKTVLVPFGNQCKLTFIEATEEPYLLEVKVHDSKEGFGSGSIIVHDPPTFPNTYLGVYGGLYTYFVSPDTTGTWYYSVDGSNGSIVSSSTDCASIINALSALNPTRINSIKVTSIALRSDQNYTITQGISLYSCTKLLGVGGQAAITRTAGGTFVAISNHDVAAGNFEITLENLKLISGAGGTKQLIKLENTDMYVSNKPAWYVTLYQCYIKNVMTIGDVGMFSGGVPQVTLDTYSCDVEGLDINGLSVDGLYLKDVNDAVFHKIHISGIWGTCIRMVGGNANLLDLLWLGAHQQAINITSTSKCSIVNSWMWGASRDLVGLADCWGMKIDNNQMYLASSGGLSNYPYVTFTNVTTSSVSNNLMSQHGAEALYPSYGIIDTGVTTGNNTFIGNICAAVTGFNSTTTTDICEHNKYIAP